jgi:PAS domain S-box-containing protein
MFKEKPFNVLIFCFIVTFASATLQYINPSNSFFDSGLIVAILLTIFLDKDVYTKVFGGLSICFILIAAFYHHENMSREQVITQHLFSFVIILLTVIFVLYLKKLYRSIELEKRQVNALFEHATEGIILTDEKGAIVLINPAALRLFEYEGEELLGKTVEVLIPGRFHHSHLQYRAGFHAHPSNRTMGQGRELFGTTKSKKEFPVEVSLSWYRQNNALYVIAFVIDITQRRQAEEEMLKQKGQLEQITSDVRKLNIDLENKVEQRTLILKEALQELESSQAELNAALSKEKELNEIKSRFVSMASHEFRTPLSTVLSSAALLSRYTQADEQEKRDKHIRRIKESVKQLNSLLEDFLSLGQLEEGRVRVEPSHFLVKGFTDEVVEELQPIIKDGQVIVQNYFGPDSFVTDKRLLKNILINLLSNAVKFSAERSSIWLDIQNQQQGLVVIVKDEGLGISEEDQLHLFSSFFRGKNVVNIEGTGLGLHIVRRYVDLLNGKVSLESKLDQGTCITVWLPILEPAG